jgi:predicted phage-related endonuclease
MQILETKTIEVKLQFVSEQEEGDESPFYYTILDNHRITLTGSYSKKIAYSNYLIELANYQIKEV